MSVIFGQLSPTDNGDTIVILSGDPEAMDKALAGNPRVKSLFPYHFHFSDYTPEELLEIAIQKVAEKNYTLHPKAKEAFKNLVSQVCNEHDKFFGNALFVEKMVDKAIHNLSALNHEDQEGAGTYPKGDYDIDGRGYSDGNFRATQFL